jgi:hypothetical protein
VCDTFGTLSLGLVTVALTCNRQKQITNDEAHQEHEQHPEQPLEQERKQYPEQPLEQEMKQTQEVQQNEQDDTENQCDNTRDERDCGDSLAPTVTPCIAAFRHEHEHDCADTRIALM